ncbi:cell division septum initiation protein DivIVA [Actinoplanes octamycinicus]|uniref:Cell division septum initiation protein DivIVA n=1 Tax=Actinoplanes octamycinicus TaxID=135948 RepID=A0A7W7H1D1_9ACTN|nr:hypothetical protein [Actinoplanes octamycinicus]MBB4742019.1 cell division septum initiation protein DivIVA [Actinoplanes octamycinicus]GIE60782.1 hypothetical protein Aoc01nite_61840 [Actinoplanes octamycinicus]
MTSSSTDPNEKKALFTSSRIRDAVFRPAPSRRRSYDGDAVDAFLTEVEREFTRLQTENRDMREQLRHSRPSAEDLVARLEQHRIELAHTEQQARETEAALRQAREAAARAGTSPFVTLAQRFADSHVRDAEREADALVDAARAKADKIAVEAQLLASTIDSDARARHHQAISRLSDERAAILAEIERLTGLAATLHGSLRDQMTVEIAEVPLPRQTPDLLLPLQTPEILLPAQTPDLLPPPQTPDIRLPPQTPDIRPGRTGARRRFEAANTETPRLAG